MQANQVDCGVYVCIYASELVARGFANLDDGLPALPYGGGLFRRGDAWGHSRTCTQAVDPNPGEPSQHRRSRGVLEERADPAREPTTLPPSKPWRRLRNSSSKGILIRFKRPTALSTGCCTYDRRCIDLVSSRCVRWSSACPFGGSLWVYGPAATDAITLCRGSGWIGGVRGPAASGPRVSLQLQAVIRRSKPPRGRVWQLTGEEMDLLDGCTADIQAPTAPAAALTTLAPANAGIAPPAMALAPAQPTPPGGATAVHVGTTPVPAVGYSRPTSPFYASHIDQPPCAG
ncbi:unnamed protein product [Closterium sp. NIES-64]|nr:unnamed protein product [Closterium sp. NIES-64]